MVLIIDNYDSFTYNLVQYIEELGSKTKVYRNDRISIPEIEKLNPKHILISPGPCDPKKAGISIEVVKHFYKTLPILGVCLGHQTIAESLGGNIIKAPRVMHGKISKIHHNRSRLFKGIPSPFRATRYHSLIVDPKSIPDELEITAWTENDRNSVTDIMGLAHKEKKVYGVQFHPESISSEFGHKLIKNFLHEV